MGVARKCEDCGDDMAKRRFRCPVCHYLLCNFCYGTHVKANDLIPLKQLRKDSRAERRVRGANSRSAALPPKIKHHYDCPAAYFGFKPGVNCMCDVDRSQA